MGDGSATCVWHLSPEVLSALHARFGAPADTYGNGSQTWLRSDGPDGTPMEWRLHPRADFSRPAALRTDQVFTSVAGAIARGEDPPLPPSHVWTGLEASWAFEEDLGGTELEACATAALGVAPDAHGPIDRDALGVEWERSGGRLDVVAWLLTQLA